MLHFLNRLCVVMIRQLFETPVEAHLGVDEICVDRCQLYGQTGVQCFDDFFVSFHVFRVFEILQFFFGKGEINLRRVAIKPNTEGQKKKFVC